MTLINNLFVYFRNRDKRDDEQLKMWFEEVEFVDSDAMRYIYDKMIQDKSLPYNIPRTIKKHYFQWRQENKRHEDFTRVRAMEFCKYCYDTGYLEFQCEQDGYKWRMMARCGHCRIHEHEDWHTDKPYKGQPADVYFPKMPKMTIKEALWHCDNSFKNKGINAYLIRFKDFDEHVKDMSDGEYTVRQMRGPHKDDKREVPKIW